MRDVLVQGVENRSAFPCRDPAVKAGSGCRMAAFIAHPVMQLRAHALARPPGSPMMFPATTARSRLRQRYAVRVVSGEQLPELTRKPVRRARPAQSDDAQQKQRPPPQHQAKKQSNQQEQRYLQPRRQSSKQPQLTDQYATPTQLIKGQRSIAGVVQLVQQYASDGSLDSYRLGAGLDRTVWLAKKANSGRDGVAAWGVLRPLSMGLLQELDAWALVALLRAAAHFDSFSADKFKAWQAALKTQRLERLPEVAASNALLSLHTLTAGSEALKAAVDASLVVRLVQGWLQLVPGMLSLNLCQGLYGAVCLGYPFSQQELDRITQQALPAGSKLVAMDATQLLRAWSLLDTAWQKWDTGRQQSAVAAASKRQPQAVYPGNATVEEVLRRVLSSDMNAREASQILLALGQLRFRPSAAATAALVDVYVRCLEKQQYTNINLCAFLDGCALLGCRLPPAAVESCLEAVGTACASDPSDAPRCISTAAWALAHLQQCNIEAWQQLAGLAAAVPFQEWSAVSLYRLFQAYMHVWPGHGQAVQLPVQLLRAASAALAQEINTKGTANVFHCQVARELEAACPGEAVEVEQPVGPGGRSGEAALAGWEEGWLQVNLAVPSLRLVVQADGPFQYFCNKREVPLPTTLARDRLLRSWGWHVISVPFNIPKQQLADHLTQQLRELRWQPAIALKNC